jgi:hypothetical protein
MVTLTGGRLYEEHDRTPAFRVCWSGLLAAVEMVQAGVGADFQPILDDPHAVGVMG